MEPIVHICKEKEWEAAKLAGEYLGDTLDSQGFVHCSKPDQVLRVANAIYQEVPDLVLLWIDPRELKPELRWEAADGDVFPHIYGPINLQAVYARTDLVPDHDGIFRGLSRPE